VFRLDLDIRVSVLVRIPPQWAGRAASVLWLWASHLCFSAPLLLCSSAPLLLCSSAPLDLCTSEYLLLWISGASILWRTGEGKTLSERYADHLFRWIGRQLLEVVSTEFRDRSVDYYVRGSDPFRFARGVLDRI
jgi:hypothetical protein